jgi:hypothetical protein
MKLKRTRTYLELRVGSRLLVEVVLYIRQTDLAWFNHEDRHGKDITENVTIGVNNDDDDDDDNHSSTQVDHGKDLLAVLETSVLPRMMHQEVEDLYYKPYPKKLKPPPLGAQGIPILTGDNQSTKSSKKKQQNSKRGSKRTAKNKGKGMVDVDEDIDDNTTKRTTEKEVFYAFGQSLQLAYKCEDIALHKSKSMTLVFPEPNDQPDDDAKKTRQGEGILYELDRLPKRIVAWIFPFDPTQPNQPDPTDGGFPIPERIPIAHLIRHGVAATMDIGEKKEE